MTASDKKLRKICRLIKDVIKRSENKKRAKEKHSEDLKQKQKYLVQNVVKLLEHGIKIKS